ncbi:UNVERIFIED_CONTAM: CRISPR-associated helicase/endonuclease Cas3 [Clostridioides difficile]|uniref:CRISPR-associated helicase/endonuclease Cas3 n=1 Tax=Clostridioides difficile TaxID=1496 RepID=UPI00038DAF68|nr:CRISPR-associated helicase/endonuclease Cas3 [Clostridioides difficile]EQE83808.1 CRISPR-associated endonuclease Cas3-HD [Clostridioides difficile CD69]MEC5402012.1 CRISPR-associated helicase/endonuclease Cas3 [Clostridioides difficile]HBE9332884.1 CRISPR-associated helicase/endonuclease Cas3 [Clostridioides difficile]HBF7936756.1 CRISPR-associated helicase/endonuclease Cas3 [Clostridioides difficile]HBG6489637.1 CRISPR-associated helicase/endonuclease Cas3 [Clostridioides difficile]
MLYAKSNPVETLREHTDELLKQMNMLRECYGTNINSLNFLEVERFWQLLDFVIEFHDIGKAFSPFQKLIRSRMDIEVNEPKIVTHLENNIGHNYLSPAFIDYRYIDRKKDRELRAVLIQVIVYHHERDVFIDKDFRNLIQKILDEDLINKGYELQHEFKVRYPIRTEELSNTYLQSVIKRIDKNHKYYNLYIMLKGILHRLDHSASAHEIVECNSNMNIGEYTEKHLVKEFGSLREVQSFAKSNRNKNIILIASTGMGKTETALIWIDKDKAFFTLPLRVSINALFDRAKNIIGVGEANDTFLGLLHSTAIDYLEESNQENSNEIVDLAKLLSCKLTFSTIDQIFKFPFLYRGYEKVYSTLAYSKVVIDEIQAYSPEIAAVLVKGIEMIHKIGGKFMIMTATMPTIYIDELKKRDVIDSNLADLTCNTEKIRHCVSIVENSIDENLDKIIQSGMNKKVLVIVNTVKSAVEKYELIEEIVKTKGVDVNLNLLHSMYIQEDRAKLEKYIKEFANSDRNGIWITTQLVEASLDIDFDELHTENSTLDSLFQRFGRCYRSRGYEENSPNIFIYTEKATGIGSIYDKDIVEKGLELLKTFINGKECVKMKEKYKVEMVKILYSKESLEGTAFEKRFTSALNILDTITPYSLGSKDAQNILRNIEGYTVIPEDIYNKIEKTLLKDYEALGKELTEAYSNEDRESINEIKSKRKKARREIIKKSVNIPIYKVKQNIEDINIKGLEDLKILLYKYDIHENKHTKQIFGKGVLISNEIDQFI